MQGGKKMTESQMDTLMRELQVRKATVELRKMTAEANQAELNAALPQFPESLPEGKLDAGEKGSPIAVLAAHRALDGAAMEIAQKLPKDLSQLWIVTDDRAERFRACYVQLIAQFERVKTALNEALASLGAGKIKTEKPRETEPAKAGTVQPPTGAEAILPLSALSGIATVALSALPTIMSLFKKDITIRPRDVSISPEALIAAVTRNMLSNRPDLTIVGRTEPAEGGFVSEFETLIKCRDMLALKLAEFRSRHAESADLELAVADERLAALKVQLSALTKDNALGDKINDLIDAIAAAASRKAEIRARRAGPEAAIRAAEQTLAVVDDFIARVQTADGSGRTPLGAANAYAAWSSASVLFLESSFAGGESQYEKKIGKDHVLNGGAAIVIFTLFSDKGEVRQSGICTATCIGDNEVGSEKIVIGDPQIPWENIVER
jgi:hypothetical protein